MSTDLAFPTDQYSGWMRWDEVFADLQAEFEAAARSETEAEIVELVQAEVAGIEFADRLRARKGHPITVRLTDGSDRAGVLMQARPRWIVLGEQERRSLVPVGMVTSAWPLGPVAPEPSAIESRLGLGHALRGLAQAGAPVLVCTVGGDYRGNLIRVGADHCDVRLASGTVVTVPWRGLLSVESR